MRHGRLAGTAVVDRRTDPRPAIAALRPPASTSPAPVAPAPAAHPEETDLVLAWLDAARRPAVEAPGGWACPVRGAERYAIADRNAAAGRRARRRPRCAATLAPGRRPGALSGSSRRDRRGMMASMLTAIVLIDTDAARIPEVAAAIAEVPGVSEVYSVTGEVDLIAHGPGPRARGPRRRHRRQGRARSTGVVRTQTYIAFRTYSKHDLEQAFALGLED